MVETRPIWYGTKKDEWLLAVSKADYDALAAELKIQDDANDIMDRRVAALEAALRTIRDFRDEQNEWDGVEVCMPAMRAIARTALGFESETKGEGQ